MTGARRATAIAGLFLGVAVLIGACERSHGRHDTARDATAPVVLFFGDSITHGYGLPDEQTFPALLEARLAAEGYHYRCVNAGVSGDTTSSALERMPAYLADAPRVVVVELGANDAFGGMSRVRTRANLLEIIRAFRKAGSQVVLAGTLFAHTHPAYWHAMERLYERVAHESGVLLIPDLMKGVAGVAELNLADGLHPNAEGHRRLADTAWPVLLETVRGLGPPP